MNGIQTLPIEEVSKQEATDPYALYPSWRVTSPLGPVVVRQDSPQGPKYQEAQGYSFLVNSMKYPRLCRMEGGRLVLRATAALHQGFIENPINYVDDPISLHSTDEGDSWSQPQRVAMHGLPISLGGGRLMLYGSERNEQGVGRYLWFSNDAGQTWSDGEPIPPLPDGRTTHQHGSVLVEDDTVTLISYAQEPNSPAKSKDAPTAVSVLRRYHVDTHTWDEPCFFPKEYRSSEGSIARAGNGDLVASFRTARPGAPVHSDHWRGISTSCSSDDGRSWSEPQVHFLYGHVHHELLSLADGRVMMTYAARIGELDGMTYHGVEAVSSDDHGKTWDWPNRYIIFRWHYPSTHSPQSVQLSDGRILTSFMYGQNYSWDCREVDRAETPPKWRGYFNFLGNVSVVIWSL